MAMRRIPLRILGLAALAAFSTAGLIGPAMLPGGTPVLAMVGGAAPAANGVGRSVVMILGSYGTACTATAIARDLLLTAAHCVQPGADYKLVDSEPGRDPIICRRSKTSRVSSAIRSSI